MSRWTVKNQLFEQFGVVVTFAPDGTAVRMVECQFPGCTTRLTFNEATLDRYPVPGREGGTYHRDNVRIACEPCNTADGFAHGGEGSVLMGMTKHQRKLFRAAMRRGKKPVITPEEILGPRWREGYVWEHSPHKWASDLSGTPVIP